MERVGEEFNDVIQHYKDSWLPARSIVLSAIEKRHEVVNHSLHPLSMYYRLMYLVRLLI